MATAESPGDRAWFIAQRWQQYAGEAQANLLRIAAIGVFYLLHLWNYLGSQGIHPKWGLLELSSAGTIDSRFHLLATLLAVAWAMGAAAIHLCLRHQVFPRWISTAATLLDLVMLTSLLCIGGGPQSPLVVGYFLVIALAALRFSLPLVRLATIGSAIGYFCTLGVARWPATFGRAEAVDLRVPRYEQLATLLALILCGVFVGQVVRRARSAAEMFANQSGDSRRRQP